MPTRLINRRDILKLGTATGAGLALGRIPLPARAQSQRLSVLSLERPDPIPPGVQNFALDLLDVWQSDHDTAVDYDARPFFEIASASRTIFDSGQYVHDIFYNWATIPEVANDLLELGSRLPSELLNDLAPSQAASVSWQGKQYGVVPTLSLLLPLYNQTLFDTVGISALPTTWDELKAALAEFGGEQPRGLLAPWGAPAGIGGITSIWMAFLQQAGGRVFDDTGKPVFDDAPGVDALQFMIDLLPYTVVDSYSTISSGRIANLMNADVAAVTFSFPAFWDQFNGSALPGEWKITPAPMPKGPESNATVNGVDAWTIAANSPNPELAQQLIEFYLSPDVQKRQFTDTGWLPARLSVLADADIQSINALAPVLLEQAKSPFDSFVIPNYLAITNTLGQHLQKAARKELSAAQALQAAKLAIEPLLIF